MQKWLKISIFLCTFGFFREFRPSEPFITEFLSGDWRNITSDQVNRDVYPYGTYSYFALLVVVFLITDMLRYKPIIIVSACCGIIIWSLLLWTYTLPLLQLVQVVYGLYMATEVGYYTYIFAKVDRSKYQQVTGHTRSAYLIGRFASSVIAQALVSSNLMDFRDLNYLSLGSQCISLIFAIFLPSVSTSMYFYKNEPAKSTDSLSTIQKSAITTEPSTNDLMKDASTFVIDTNTNSSKTSFSCTHALSLLWTHFKTSYSNKIVIQWSFWWALAMAGFLQVQVYVQLLWKEIDNDRESRYNGAVEAALTLLGALGAFQAGFLESKRFDRWDIWIITLCSATISICIFVSTFTDIVYVAYAMYILFGTVYHFMITIASAAVAKNIADDSFALIFGINTLLALAFQSIFTVVFVAEEGFGLDIRNQFIASGSYFMCLAIVYLFVGLYSFVVNRIFKRTKDN